MAAHLKLAGADDGGSQMLDGVRVPTEVRLVAVDALLPYARNSRNHDKAQVAAIARSMKEVGFTNPLLIADGGILAGHGRLMAAKSIGLSRVPCIDLSHLSEPQRRALVIADNRLAEMASWDLEMLKLETDDLRALGLDLEAETGFAEEDLAKLFEGLEEPEKGEGKDPEAVPPAPDVPHSRLGDIWQCGPHRIACGDCADHAVIDALMQGEMADLCVTDPPYNVDIGGKNKMLDRADGGNRSKSGSINNDKMDDAEFRKMLTGWYATMFDVMKPGAPIYVAHADTEGMNFRNAFAEAGFKLSGCLIWRKNIMVLGRSDYQWLHEPILYGWKPGAAHRWYGGRKRTTILEYGEQGPVRQLADGRWAITVGDNTLIVDGQATLEEVPGSVIFHEKPARSELHPTTKPVGLWEKLMKPSSRPGDIVIDWFSGSGTTMIAADRMGLIARVCDLDPKFVDVAVRRWEMLTGRRAVHAVTGEPFPRDGEVRQPAAPVVPDAPDDGQPF